MRHLISPQDLSMEELDELLTLGQDIMNNQSKYAMSVMVKNLLLYFMNQVHVPDLSFEAAMINMGDRYLVFHLRFFQLSI